MTVSALTLPSEFWTKTSARLLLPPEPDYFFANLLYQSAAEAELRSVEATNGLPQNGAPVPEVPGLSLNDKTPYTDALIFEDFRAEPGQTVRMNRQVFADTTYTEASRRATRATVGSAGADISGEQVEMTIERFMGPLVSAGGAIGPHILEEFDIKRNPIHNLVQRVGVALKRDRNKFVDSVVAAKACTGAPSTNYIYAGDPNNAITADASAFSAQGDRPVDVEMLLRGEARADTVGIPTFANGRRMCVLSVRQAQQLQASSRWQKLAKPFETRNPLFTKFIGSIGRMDVFVSATNPTTTTSSITVQLGAIIGPGALAYAMAMPCETRTDPGAQNYGQRVPVIWAADEAYGILDNRFLISLRSD